MKFSRKRYTVLTKKEVDSIDTVILLPKSVPQVWFAHEYGSERYDITFAVMPDRLEICYLMQGDILQEREGRTLKIPEGAVLINDYSCPTRYYSDGKYCRHRTVGLKMAYDRNEGEGAVRLPLIRPPGATATLAGQILSRIMAENAVSGPSSAKNRSLAFELLSLLDTRQPERPESNMSSSAAALADAALHYLAENLDRSVTVEEMAMALNISAGYLSMVFKQYIGQSPIAYFNRLKMERVCELMRVRGLSLKQAGACVGLLDENYLSRLFRRYTGTSVKEFRMRESGPV